MISLEANDSIWDLYSYQEDNKKTAFVLAHQKTLCNLTKGTLVINITGVDFQMFGISIILLQGACVSRIIV